MTLLQMRTIAWDYLDDPNGTYFTEPVMNLRLNLALQELQKKLVDANQNYYIQCAETELVIDQQQYALPTDFYNMSRLERITQGSGSTATTTPLQDITMNQRDLILPESGYPSHFWLEKDTINVWPVPNVSQVIRMKYSYKVAFMVNDADIPDAPDVYHKFIPVMAARDGFLKDGRDIAPIQLEIEEYKQTMIQLAVQRLKNSPRQIVATTSGFGSV